MNPTCAFVCPSVDEGASYQRTSLLMKPKYFARLTRHEYSHPTICVEHTELGTGLELNNLKGTCW